MNIIFRFPAQLLAEVHADLSRQHPFAMERVGFIGVRAVQGADNLVLLAQSYHPVLDGDYVHDPRVGAKIGADAIRKSLELAIRSPQGIFHVHRHDHKGRPAFSRVDVHQQRLTVPDYFKVSPDMPHGAVVLSLDGAAGSCWIAADQAHTIREFGIVGSETAVSISPGPRGSRGIVV